MTGDLRVASALLRKQSAEYGAGRSVIELIATMVQSAPGPDGRYRTHVGEDTIHRYLEHARSANSLLLLNIQPGRAPFLDEVARYRRWLLNPDVGVALDPEWAVPEGVVPGAKFGSTTGAELDGVAAYLAELVATSGLPDKVMVYHQVAASVVRDEEKLRPHPGVSMIKVADGIGGPALKRATWKQVMARKPAHVHAGMKLFYEEDTRHGQPLLSPAEVMALAPRPKYVVYE
ncbi:hypothetical protein [Amycolatopsis anabasis]|uniref:hypothetical protein n=1 Tax=Amycolatopsis anabasis TaxID=1840409 RepID=UPI001FE4EDF9|nr:hypothetical protein [Amycolatopsis anabasis]